jgi:type I restriction enzyme M protein
LASKPIQWTGRHQLSASPLQSSCLPLLGKKNCELSPEDIDRISTTFLDFQESPESKIFPNAAFGYWKVTVERPLRLHSRITSAA